MKYRVLIILTCAIAMSCNNSVTEEISTVTPTQTPFVIDQGKGGEPKVVNARKAKTGDNVSVHYRGTLDSGEEFDSSIGKSPLSFQLGSGQVIKGFDSAVEGLMVGETVKIRLNPDEAYGELVDPIVKEFGKDTLTLPEGSSVGQGVQFQNGFSGIIIKDDGVLVTIEIDINHAMAGKALTFEIELVSIKN
jgi:peptidylprolyl isomerase